MIIPVKNTCKCVAVVSNEAKLCAGVLSEVDIIDHHEVFVEILDVVADIVQVLGCGDSVRVIRLARSAAVFGLGCAQADKYAENCESENDIPHRSILRPPRVGKVSHLIHHIP